MRQSVPYLLTFCSILMLVPTVQAADVSMSQSQLEALEIRTATPQPASSVAGEAYPAQVRVPPANQTVLAAPVDGLVERVRVATGETVGAGDPLLSLRSPGLLSMQRDYLEALSAHGVLAQALERDRALAEEGIIAQRRLDETRGRYEQSRSRLSAMRQSLILAGMGEQAIDDLARSRKIDSVIELVSPRDGTVMEIMAAAGERVQAASALARISALDTLWLEVRLPAERLDAVAPGTRIVVEGSGTSGEVILVGSEVDRDDQTVMVRARVDNSDRALRPGQFLRVRLTGEEQAGLFEVPASAVVRQGDGYFVFVASEGGFDARPVDRLDQSGDRVTVRGELTTTDRVASEGVATIKGAWQGMGGDE